jgi:hypothetical protein
MGILDFLFGAKPKLTFTDKGRVLHNHTEKKWEDWKNRFKQNSDYNWKRHSGTEGVPRLNKK